MTIKLPGNSKRARYKAPLATLGRGEVARNWSSVRFKKLIDMLSAIDCNWLS